MKRILILGAGTAGTMMAHHLARKVDARQWSITMVDQHKSHYYQPGFLFIPFGKYTEDDVIRPKREFIPRGVEYIEEKIEVVEADHNRVQLADGRTLPYDLLFIATGSRIVPEEINGLKDDGHWHKDVFDFYTIEGARALREKFKNWKGGRLVVHLAEMPIKCPVAPLEFTFLADWFLRKQGLREGVELTYVTPLSEAFTKHNCALVLGHLLKDKDIHMQTDFNVERVDGAKKQLIGFDGRAVDYDLMVCIPTNMGDPVIERSGLGDDLNFVPTNKHTLQANGYENVFVIGDANDTPASKAGSVAHFAAEVLTRNVLDFMHGRPMREQFDGHANCFIESGNSKAFLIDFNYDIEPLEGKFPLPVVGPFSLLKETRLNHMGKLAFKWIYWNILLKGLPMPGITSQMSTRGKKMPAA